MCSRENYFVNMLLPKWLMKMNDLKPFGTIKKGIKKVKLRKTVLTIE